MPEIVTNAVMEKTTKWGRIVSYSKSLSATREKFKVEDFNFDNDKFLKLMNLLFNNDQMWGSDSNPNCYYDLLNDELAVFKTKARII